MGSTNHFPLGTFRPIMYPLLVMAARCRSLQVFKNVLLADHSRYLVGWILKLSGQMPLVRASKGS